MTACQRCFGFVVCSSTPPPSDRPVRKCREGEERVQYRPDREFWEIAKPAREPSQSWLFRFGVVLALIVSTPWYLPAGVAAVPILGLPIWVWCALGGGLILAVTTSWAALRCWSDPAPAKHSSSRDR